MGDFDAITLSDEEPQVEAGHPHSYNRALLATAPAVPFFGTGGNLPEGRQKVEGSSLDAD
ncbi:MAG: hypothetical protein GYB67_05560 [Chloroflexi bacterium]|nr:hypothetical protein [Chloroflexota bacterium]